MWVSEESYLYTSRMHKKSSILTIINNVLVYGHQSLTHILYYYNSTE